MTAPMDAPRCQSRSVVRPLELADLLSNTDGLLGFTLEVNASDDFLAKIAAFVKINATELIHGEFLR